MSSVKKNLHHHRKDYTKDSIGLENTNASPFTQFDLWYHQAEALGGFEANAMILSSVDKNLMPSSRVVLMKEYSEKGLVFYTNYNSRKGQELLDNPQASILFFYEQMERQIRIQGRVSRISEEQSELYFQSRPLESQYGAIASPQSHEIASKLVLEDKMSLLREGNKKPQRPKLWGGYLLEANYFEFWQGRPNRLHDRVCYELVDATWRKFLIAP